jgi:cephalosporin hydroxylase
MLRKIKQGVNFGLYKLLPRFYFSEYLTLFLIHHMKPYIYIDQWSIQPFNGQIERAKQIRAIAKAFHPTVCIETGTYFGTSTPHLASMVSGKTFTIEINYENFKNAQERITRNFPMLNIQCILGNSVIEMEKVLASLNPESERILAYLDAHWLKEIPTRRELELLCEWGGEWVGIIDDFQVPNDESYLYDSYEDHIINLSQVPKNWELKVYVPSSPGSVETGARRGTGFVFSKSSFAKMNKEVFTDLKVYGS